MSADTWDKQDSDKTICGAYYCASGGLGLVTVTNVCRLPLNHSGPHGQPGERHGRAELLRAARGASSFLRRSVLAGREALAGVADQAGQVTLTIGPISAVVYPPRAVQQRTRDDEGPCEPPAPCRKPGRCLGHGGAS